MDIELATTTDMLNELRRRRVHFVYTGVHNSNLGEDKICYACQGYSRTEILELIQLLQCCVEADSDLDAVE